MRHMMRLAVALGIGALMAGCTTADLAQLESPLVVAGISTASYQGCVKAARADADKAAVGLRVLNGLLPQLMACQSGLTDGLADPNAD